jgi:hypothetical protein
VIDGNVTDLINYAASLEASGQGCGLNIVDKPDAGGNPTPETIYNDLKFIPCPTPQPALGTHWVNGVEIFRHYFAYSHGSTVLFLGLTAEGFIGDSTATAIPTTPAAVRATRTTTSRTRTASRAMSSIPGAST